LLNKRLEISSPPHGELSSPTIKGEDLQLRWSKFRDFLSDYSILNCVPETNDAHSIYSRSRDRIPVDQVSAEVVSHLPSTYSQTNEKYVESAPFSIDKLWKWSRKCNWYIQTICASTGGFYSYTGSTRFLLSL
jgi:hypothetical protein